MDKSPCQTSGAARGRTMTAGFLFSFGFIAGVFAFCSIVRRGLGRTIIGLLKVAFWSVATLAAFAVVVVVLFHLIAVGDQPEPQANAGAPAGNWLSDK
jgi:hypothetical protein